MAYGNEINFDNIGCTCVVYDASHNSGSEKLGVLYGPTRCVTCPMIIHSYCHRVCVYMGMFHRIRKYNVLYDNINMFIRRFNHYIKTI